MTMTDNNNEQATTTPKHTYEVLTGHRYVIEAGEKFEALREAGEKFRKQHGLTEGNTLTDIVCAEVLEVNRQAVTIPIPEGVGYSEARNLLEWALETADRSRVDWDDIADRLKTDDTLYAVRANLGSVSYELFTAWASRLSGISYGYQATVEALAELAEECEDSYLGEYSDRAEFTQQYYEDAGELNSTPSEVLDAVDWEQVWDYALAYDMEVVDFEGDEHFFRNH